MNPVFTRISGVSFRSIFELKIRLIFLVVFLAQIGFSQIYETVPELHTYKEQLAKLDQLLQSNPREFAELHSRLKNTNDGKSTAPMGILLDAMEGTSFYYANNVDTAKTFYEKAMKNAEEGGYDRLYRYAKIRRIFCDENEVTNTELISDMGKMLQQSINDRDTVNMMYSINGLALFYSNLDSTSKVIKLFYSGLKLAEESQNTNTIALFLNNLGLEKIDLGALDSAYSDFSRVVELAENDGNLIMEGVGRLNLGLYYARVDSHEIARRQYDTVLTMARENNFVNLEITAWSNLGLHERIDGNYEKADSMFQFALKRAKEENLKHIISQVYMNICFIAYLTERYDESIALADSAYSYIEYYSPAKEVERAVLRIKSRAYERKGDFETALLYQKELYSFNDSINEVGNEKLLGELQVQYNQGKKEKEALKKENKLRLEIKQNEIDLSNLRQRIIIGVGAALVLISVLVLLYFRNKQKREKEFSYTLANKLEEERGVIARNLHDGLGQSLAILKNDFNNLQVEENGKEEINESFTSVIEEVRSISRSLIPPELRRLGLHKAVVSTINEIERSFGIIVVHEIDCLEEIKLDDAQSLRLYRVLQELLTNTLKHSGASSIKIEALKEDNNLRIIYRDNGTGIDLDKWKSASNSVGFRSIEQRLKYLNGSIRIEKPKSGFMVQIKIKLDK